MKTGIFGGAFNPVHLGHIRLAENYLKHLGLDRVIFIPTSIAPHKSSGEFASPQDRFNMLSLATKGKSEFEISDIEFKREGKSYTFDTLCELKELYPEDEFYLIMGSDQFLYFNKWYKSEEISKLATICTAARNGEDYKRLVEFKNENKYLENSVICDFDVFEISSSKLRKMIKNKSSISEFVPEAVEEYIRENFMYNTQEYIDLIKRTLSPYRFHHSMCVAEKARELAKKYGVDEEKAYVAGVLHDITKEMPNDEQIRLIEENGHSLTYYEKNNHRIFHQMSGEAYVKNVLKIDDEDILSGIRYHTTGRENMTLFEMIIYLADFTSADRSYPDVEIMREKTDKSLLEGMLYSLKYTICDVVSNERTLHPDTLSCYNYVINKMKG